MKMGRRVTVELFGETHELRLVEIENGYGIGPRATRIDVIDETGDLYARLSVNLPDSPLADPKKFWLKDWSENAPVVRALLDAGAIEYIPQITPVASGFVVIRAARVKESA
jgi:hypothetical protein